jgi:RES domain-containing protein
LAPEARPLLRPYGGPAFCHVPAGEPLDLSKLAERDGDDGDRWNEPDEPTIYLALDLGVALAEYARHASGADARRLLRFDVGLDGVADLRRTSIRASSGHDGPPIELADRRVARRLAADLRRGPDCRGLLVPSVAFPDDPTRGNLVVFADRLPSDVAEWLGPATPVGRVELG